VGRLVRTVAEVIDQYDSNYYRRTARYRFGIGKHLIAELKKEFGDIAVDALDHQRVNVFVFRLQTSQTIRGAVFSAATINTYLVTLKSAFSFCVKAGMLKSSPIADFKLLQVKQAKKQIIPKDIIETIKKELPQWALPITVYKELVPCRVLELMDIEMSQVSEDCRKIKLRSDQTKTDQERELPIPLPLVSYFQRMRAWGSPWAFARPVLKEDGSVEFKQLRPNGISQAFRKIRDAKGFDKDIVYRKLRHSTISQWLRRYDLNLVSEVAGATPETLRKYYDVVPIEAKLTAADDFAEKNGNMTETFSFIPNCKLAASA